MVYSESCIVLFWFFSSDTKARCVDPIHSLSTGFPNWPGVYINNGPFLIVFFFFNIFIGVSLLYISYLFFTHFFPLLQWKEHMKIPTGCRNSWGSKPSGDRSEWKIRPRMMWVKVTKLCSSQTVTLVQSASASVSNWWWISKGSCRKVKPACMATLSLLVSRIFSCCQGHVHFSPVTGLFLRVVLPVTT